MEIINKKHKHKGLSLNEVEINRRNFGENILTPPEKEPLWKLFLEKFKDPIIRILLIAAFLSLGISFITNEFAETIGIFFAIFPLSKYISETKTVFSLLVIYLSDI